MEINDYSYDEIEVGHEFGFERTIAAGDADLFLKLTGDSNPLHFDEGYAATTSFRKPISHGMHIAGLFSSLVGMVCPGKRNLYMSQTLQFRSPVYPGSTVQIKGRVKSKVDSVKMVVIETQAVVDGKVAIDGEAKVRVL